MRNLRAEALKSDDAELWLAAEALHIHVTVYASVTYWAWSTNETPGREKLPLGGVISYSPDNWQTPTLSVLRRVLFCEELKKNA